MRKEFILRARGRTLTLGRCPIVMGIVNVTPDSFSGDGKTSVRSAVRYAVRQVREGAAILDIGGESSRPGAERVTVRGELRRVIPVIRALRPVIDVPISIDSYKPEVVLAALEAGADIVNLIKGTPANPRILRMVRDHDAAIVLMHMRGTPGTMQQKTDYKDILREVSDGLKKSVEKCLGTGITRDKIIIDPGIGFAKTAEQNLFLLRHLSRMASLGCPVLTGISRKSFIGKVLGQDVRHRLIGTIAANVLAAVNGAHIIRAHDVREAVQALTMADAIMAATV